MTPFHHVSDYPKLLSLTVCFKDFKEWWHEEDASKPPRAYLVHVRKQRKLAGLPIRGSEGLTVGNYQRGRTSLH